MARKRVRIERGLYRDGAIFYACATPPGSRSAVWRSLGAVGKMEARRLRDEFTAEVRKGEAQASAREGRRATFADVARQWLAAQRALVDVGELAPRTVDGYELSVRRHLVPWFGSRPIRGITPNELVAWHADQRRSGAAAWSIKGRWNALRGVLGHAVRHGLLAGNPADTLTARERPKPGGSSKRFLTEEEMRAILDTASGRSRTLIAVLLFSGLRISEALGLVWGDVDIRTGHLRVRHQLARNGNRIRVKTTGSHRDVVIMDTLARNLRRHQLASKHSKPGDFVFATATGSALSSRNAGRAIDRIAAEAGLASEHGGILAVRFRALVLLPWVR